VGGLDEVAAPIFLTIRWPDGRKQDDPDGQILPNEAAAVRGAYNRELRKENGYNDLGQMMLVRNERRQIVLMIPFSQPALKGCLPDRLIEQMTP
jgi:hypothetical protein